MLIIFLSFTKRVLSCQFGHCMEVKRLKQRNMVRFIEGQLNWNNNELLILKHLKARIFLVHSKLYFYTFWPQDEGSWIYLNLGQFKKSWFVGSHKLSRITLQVNLMSASSCICRVALCRQPDVLLLKSSDHLRQCHPYFFTCSLHTRYCNNWKCTRYHVVSIIQLIDWKGSESVSPEAKSKIRCTRYISTTS